MRALKILAPCGMLGYGYPLKSFREGMKHQPDAIVVDAGSTDAGPHKLGAGVAIVSRQACRKDLTPMLLACASAHIPVIIGSAGGSGGKVHVEWTLDILRDICVQERVGPLKLAVIWADIPHGAVAEGLRRGKVQPLGDGIPELTEQRLAETTGIVAQMGHEPILAALRAGADVIVCGRAYDPAPFAALAAHRGLDLALGYHMGKILECAALCAVPGTTKDCMLGTLDEQGFMVTPLGGGRKCTPLTVAAHTFYEKDHPYLLHGPGHVLDLSGCRFAQADPASVRVTGSAMSPSLPYRIKLEGARLDCYRTMVVAGIRDPLLIAQLTEVEALCEEQVRAYYGQPEGVRIRFLNYGLNGVMGALEPCKQAGHEVGVVFEVLAGDQETANAMCATLRSTLLHYGYPGRKSTAGNLAFPFAPSDIPAGPVYEFSVYHLMEVESPGQFFPMELGVLR